MTNDNITNTNNDQFWINDPMVLFRDKNYCKFLPTKQMNKIQVLNALTRFFIYLFILYILFSPNKKFWLVPIIAIIIIIIIYYVFDDTSKNSDSTYQETFAEDNSLSKTSQISSKDNPFMNITLADLMDNTNHECIMDTETTNNTKQYGRQFYTMPSTTFPNDQTTFAKWLYEAPETCKENPLNCLKYEDLRFSRYNPTVDRTTSDN